jgi:hypothetical protein
MKDNILRRLAKLRLSHLPHIIRDWIFQDLEGLDPASVEAILTPEYAVLATSRAIEEMVEQRPATLQKWVAADGSGQVIETITVPRRAIEEMPRVGIPVGRGVRQKWVAADGSGRVLETVTITRRAVRNKRPQPRKYLADQMEFGFAASLTRPAAARPPEGR